jgi:hypothetical protein
MQTELYCPCCQCRFRAAANTPANAIVDRMTEEGPWIALGEGETFEDMIVAALAQRGRILCPECRQVLSIQKVGSRRRSRALAG